MQRDSWQVSSSPLPRKAMTEEVLVSFTSFSLMPLGFSWEFLRNYLLIFLSSFSAALRIQKKLYLQVAQSKTAQKRILWIMRDHTRKLLFLHLECSSLYKARFLMILHIFLKQKWMCCVATLQKMFIPKR